MPLPPALEPATPDDVEAIAAIWHEGWRDGHLGHVPEALEPHRRPPPATDHGWRRALVRRVRDE